MIKVCNRVIEFSFYALFLLTPLLFAGSTSELFEFNKMWFVYIISLVIAASWFSKMILQGRIFIQRTPLDIPILLFLSSQIFSTLFSLDTHVSIWGYYSRFNGGLLSILSYIFLYYSFVSNLGNIIIVKRLLKLSLVSGLIVTFWGLPSHFGYDPTCFIFRGDLDVSCWTDAFQPKIRIFSTLGQPNWLAAYLAILIPIAIAFFFQKTQMITLKTSKSESSEHLKIRSSEALLFRVFRVFRNPFTIYYLLFTILYYLALLYTSSRSGFIGLTAGLLIFLTGAGYVFLKIKNFEKKYLIILFVIIAAISLFIGTPFTKAFDYFKNTKGVPINTQKTDENIKGAALEVGGTDSGKIRQIVWQGALDVWKSSPVFGSGVETFAFAYYKFRPAAHNMVSEWDYLYNKAHNEYLNYLATTGLFGLGSYLAMIGLFLFLIVKNLKSQFSNPKQYQNPNNQNLKSFEQFKNWNLFEIWNLRFGILALALLASYISILVSNFFGFSVVIVNLYLFLIPAFVLVLMNLIEPNNRTIEQPSNASLKLSAFQYLSLASLLLITSYLLLNLIRFWVADTNYALGYNIDRAGGYEQAYPKLKEAVLQRDDEPTFKDELSINSAILAVAFASQSQEDPNASSAAIQKATRFAKEAIELSNNVVLNHPNNLVFQKTRARLFYTLSQADQGYLAYALQALIKAHELAPTDAKIAYNLGVVYGQTGNVSQGRQLLEQTIKLKPDYKDAYYALGLFYREEAIDKAGKVVKTERQQKAVETMKLILNRFDKKDAKATESLKTWGEL